MTEKVSIVIPIFNEEKYVANCIDSILANSYPIASVEIILIDGNSTDGTVDIVKAYVSKYEFIHLLFNPQKIVPISLNKAIKFTSGSIIIRMDAHSIYPSDYISKLVFYLKKLNASNVGGVIKTLSTNSKPISKSIALVLSHPFGVGNSYFRTGYTKIKIVDTVPFGCFNKKLFDQIGYFDEDLIRNQDDELNARIRKNGGKIYLIPEVVIKYYARDKISKLSTMFYQYGLFKPLVNKKIGTPATTRQFFPLLFVFGIIFGLLLSFIWSKLFIIYFSVLLLYLSLSLYFSIKIAIKEKVAKYLIFLPVIFFVIHFSYGWGYLIGIFKFIIFIKKKINISINR